VVILAGGEATRLSNKLELAAGAVPLLVRVYRNVCTGRETFISCKQTFSPEIDFLLHCPMVVDRWSRRGPLSGLLSTLEHMRSRYVFAVAGDAPLVGSAFIDELAAHARPGDEALVPRHDGMLEPLAAIYERTAFMRAGLPVLAAGTGALQLVIDALATRFVDIDPVGARIFTNVNTPADYAAITADSTNFTADSTHFAAYSTAINEVPQ
jgi:molybdopterin-guanine dinucleotide biosynthesis protein A